MASPQVENGFTRISNELLEAIISTRFSSRSELPMKIILHIIRKTYGFHKKVDRISLSQFAEVLAYPRPNIHYWLKKLVALEVLVVLKQPEGCYYGLNKDYSRWVVALELPVVLEQPTSSARATSGSSSRTTSTSSSSATYKRKGKKGGKKTTKKTPPTPRQRGTNPRARGANPRSTGTNPRANGTNPRSRGGPLPAREEGGEIFLEEASTAPGSMTGDRRVDYLTRRDDFDQGVWEMLVEFVGSQPDTVDKVRRSADFVKSYGFYALKKAMRDPNCVSLGKLHQYADYHSK